MNIRLGKNTSLVAFFNTHHIQIDIVLMDNHGNISILHLFSTSAIMEFFFGRTKQVYEIIEEYPYNYFIDYKGEKKIHSFIIELVDEISFRERISFFKEKVRKYRLKAFNEEIKDFEYVVPYGYGCPPKNNPFKPMMLSTIVTNGVYVHKKMIELRNSIKELEGCLK